MEDLKHECARFKAGDNRYHFICVVCGEDEKKMTLVDAAREMLELAEHPSCYFDEDEARRLISELAAELLTLQDRYNAMEKAYVNLIAAVHAIIGYTSSLVEGDVITKGYVERLESYYVKNLEQALTQLKAKEA